MFWYKVPINLIRLLNHRKRFDINTYRLCHQQSNFCIEKLKKRKIIRVAGEGSSDFLQGLITNDINSLTSSTYAMFLNNRGRILFDSIIYGSKENDTFLVECDSEILTQLIKHLNFYKLKRKIDICSLDSEFNVYCIYNPVNINSIGKSSVKEESKFLLKDSFSSNENIIITPDPRTCFLGYRVIIRGEERLSLSKGDTYQICRYKLGIGEGAEEFLVGQKLPLEMNCDFLNGVSFNKGCYIGQELTARIFHTGVIRKRLMPLVFNSEPLGVPINTPIEDLTHTRKSPIGKLTATKDVYGLGLMKVSHTIESKSLKILNYIANSYVPVWWPEETVKKLYIK